MGGSGRPFSGTRLLAGTTALAALFAFGVVDVTVAHAQDLSNIARQPGGNEQLLLEADTLVYDNDRQTVTAAGNVQIDYNGNRVVAHRVTYNQQTGRLVAVGDVAMIERDGNKIYADELDVTDDFRDGFVNALRVETADKVHFAAESAERRGGTLTTFSNGIYTACAPCESKPDSAPIWRIKSRKIIWNGQSKTVRFEHPRFELFGLPIAWLPAFEIADPTVKRKSGFMTPNVVHNSELGTKVTVPYFWALSPTYDLYFNNTHYGKQGFLGEVEWRQRFNTGGYTIKAAGIRQKNPGDFNPRYIDSQVTSRWMVGTKGKFEINPRWTFGWNVLLQSDGNFSRRYSLSGFSGQNRGDNIYLTGLNDRNFLDLRFFRFYRQEELPKSHPSARSRQQPWVLPSFDYAYTFDDPVAGGQLRLDINSQLIRREKLHYNSGAPAVRGIEGMSGRLTAEAEWKRNYIMPGGLMVTPVLAGRADGIGVNATDGSINAILDQARRLGTKSYTHEGSIYGPVGTDIRSSYYRAMATAGLEARWPVLFSTTSASHVLEPMGQVFVRPDAPYQSTLGIPNEDAQSLVFDHTTLFERDKFSGYDRIEGGVRANLGLRYSGDFGGGWKANGVFGQSYHLAGKNPFNQPDLVNVGAFSGLETDVSDYVAGASLSAPGGITLGVGGRMDEKTFELRRATAQIVVPVARHSFNASYTFIQRQPIYGFDDDRREVSVGGTVRLGQNWRARGNATYDLVSETLANSTFGFAYDDECFTYDMFFNRTESTRTKEVEYNVGVMITLRTLGEFGTSLNELDSTFGD
jgi:LPS-assembly protein